MKRRGFLGGATAIGAAALASGCDDESTEPEPELIPVFSHGVASGDALADAVILWTRVTVDQESVEVEWQIATDPELADVVASGTVSTDASRDFTVKVDVGGLSAATTYYYQFSVPDEDSPIGRARTLPDGATSRARLAVVSCASYAHGWFHAYRRLAERPDLDGIIHLGDYIYEYANKDYGDVRDYDPPHEIVTLDDYRRRYRHYRLDADLQEVHRQHTFFTVWDDHELANNAWMGGAQNHDAATEGAFAERRAAASQAYFEWMPIRPQAAPDKIFRSFAFGDLIDLFMLDTRLWGRDEQAVDKDDPAVNDPDRTLLGDDQEAWLFDKLGTSTARWKVLGQQVMMAVLPLDSLVNTDQWDGYVAARERFYGLLTSASIDDVVVLTGDIHSSWASDLVPSGVSYDPSTGAGAVAVELVGPPVTSPGVPDIFADLRDSLLADNPTFKLIDLTRKGYMILDVTPTRLQAAYYHLGWVNVEERPEESFSGAWATYPGENRLVDDGEAAPSPEAPPLAP